MENKLKHSGIILILFSISIFMFNQPVSAQENSMQQIDIHVELLEDGTGVVTEYREMDMHEGTELYSVMDNLQESELLDFEVEEFEYDPDWDVDDSREEKAGNYGVLEENDGYELVWGIGEYGENEYELTYTLSNLVRQLEDGQALLWNFDTFSDIPPEELTMEIEGHVPFTEEDTGIWGFGLEGDIQLEDGRLIWQSEQPLESDHYATVLMQFPEEPFATSVTEDMTFEEQQEMAMDGSAYNEGNGGGAFVLLILGFVGFISILVVVFAVGLTKKHKKAGQIDPVQKVKQRNKDIIYDAIPYDEGDLADVAFLLHRSGAGAFDDYFFAYLLKWAKEDRVHIVTEEIRKFLRTKEEATIEILDYEKWKEEMGLPFSQYSKRVLESKGELSFESAIWLMLLEAADGEGIVTNDLIQDWAKDHAKEVAKFAEKLSDYSKDSLENKGYIHQTKTSFLGVKVPVQQGTEKGEELADRLEQFDNYLDDLDLKEAATHEQNIAWEDLLIWAALFNEAEDVVEQLEEFFPEVWEEWVEDYPHFYGGFHGYYGFHGSWTSGLQSGGYSPSGGAGGSTSVGGGGGAGGGGGGGAR